jgi:hypothetical protein
VSRDLLRLVRQADRGDQIDVLATALGGRVGLTAVLDRLNREATPVSHVAPAADYAFRWNLGDMVTQTWWPQGITTSADADDVDQVAGRRVVMVAWYAKQRGDVAKGVRVSLVDVTDAGWPRYRHVLLVEATTGDGEPGVRPVRVHAGGLVWYGRTLLVADTRGGVRVFDLDDVCEVPPAGPWRERTFGYRFVLPQRTAYRSEHADGDVPFRFSFISVDRSRSGHRLVAGEYGRNEQTRRLTRFALDPATLAPAFDDHASARPLEVVLDGRDGMQGATTVDDTWYVATSSGPRRRGSLWTRRPGGDFVEHPRVLSIGPEDLTYWPHHDRLWNCSEWPGLRFVYAMPRSQFG